MESKGSLTVCVEQEATLLLASSRTLGLGAPRQRKLLPFSAHSTPAGTGHRWVFILACTLSGLAK